MLGVLMANFKIPTGSEDIRVTLEKRKTMQEGSKNLLFDLQIYYFLVKYYCVLNANSGKPWLCPLNAYVRYSGVLLQAVGPRHEDRKPLFREGFLLKKFNPKGQICVKEGMVLFCFKFFSHNA